jgi:hypothetical protein
MIVSPINIQGGREMSIKRVVLVVLVASGVMLAVGVGPRLAGNAYALPPVQEPDPTGVTIPYPGRLAGDAGQPVADGAYDFTFALYDTPIGGEPLWSEAQAGVAVEGGTFNVLLGGAETIPTALLDGSAGLTASGGERWLAVGVRGPGESEFTGLTPRQQLSAAAPVAPASPAAPANGMTCPHDHWGEDWSGSGSGLSIHSYDSIAMSAIGLSGSILPVLPSGLYGIYAYGETSGVYGVGPVGVQGHSSDGFGVYGTSTDSYGVYGKSTNSYGVYGVGGNAGVTGNSSDGYGVVGISTDGEGVYGTSTDGYGVHGYSYSQHGVYGKTSGNWSYHSGVYGEAVNDHANGVTGWNTGAGVGVYGYSASGYAGKFSGPVDVTGNLTKGGGGFKIDHPLDPENQYLYHSFVESPDMKNVYDGVVVLDANGAAWVELPEWFEALNKDFRYQLTPIGAPGPNLYIAQEIQNNRFQIAGGTPGMKVSWQVTGIRHDPWAEAHPIPVEEEKPPEERGTYLHPVEYGKPETLERPGAGGE